jgi:hypothetical protein
MSFNQEFTIHPIGQGFFYSGKITHNSKIKFRMVFDCGSVTSGAGQEEVDIYRDDDFLYDKTLDLLVISHFDQDHVNHIGRLLANGIKVKKLVMPFITFSERLFLIIKHLEINKGYKTDNDFFIRFTIDPLETLNENIDGDSEVFLIGNGPNEPIPQDNENSFEIIKPKDVEQRFDFDFSETVKEEIGAKDFLTKNTQPKIFKIQDSVKGNITTANSIKLMDFLFFKKAIGEDEEKFYDKVKELFYQKFKIDTDTENSIHLDKIVDEIKKIKSGKEIKKIFEEAKEIKDFKKYKSVTITDLNTTALSLLHRNLNGIFYFSKYFDKIKNKRHSYFGHTMSGITHIQKYISSHSSRIETESHFNRYRFSNYYEYNINKFIYPNVLLTSDSFLLSHAQVSEFMNHYKNYWDDYWLFQIPHHGSDKNSDALIHSMIPPMSSNFINYGIGNGHEHPSSNVIKSLVTTGNSVKTFSVNQYMGIRFNFHID